jgi:hypothetical protein
LRLAPKSLVLSESRENSTNRRLSTRTTNNFIAWKVKRQIIPSLWWNPIGPTKELVMIYIFLAY